MDSSSSPSGAVAGNTIQILVGVAHGKASMTEAIAVQAVLRQIPAAIGEAKGGADMSASLRTAIKESNGPGVQPTLIAPRIGRTNSAITRPLRNSAGARAR